MNKTFLFLFLFLSITLISSNAQDRLSVEVHGGLTMLNDLPKLSDNWKNGFGGAIGINYYINKNFTAGFNVKMHNFQFEGENLPESLPDSNYIYTYNGDPANILQFSFLGKYIYKEIPVYPFVVAELGVMITSTGKIDQYIFQNDSPIDTVKSFNDSNNNAYLFGTIGAGLRYPVLEQLLIFVDARLQRNFSDFSGITTLTFGLEYILPE